MINISSCLKLLIDIYSKQEKTRKTFHNVPTGSNETLLSNISVRTSEGGQNLCIVLDLAQ